MRIQTGRTSAKTGNTAECEAYKITVSKEDGSVRRCGEGHTAAGKMRVRAANVLLHSLHSVHDCLDTQQLTGPLKKHKQSA